MRLASILVLAGLMSADGPAPDATRLEAFALEVGGEEVGICEWRRRVCDDGVQLECAAFFVGDVRILHVEVLTDRGPRLVWRELGSGDRRQLIAEWTDDGASLRLTDWGPEGRAVHELSTKNGALMPLYLSELAREGRIASGSFLVLDPRTRQLEPVSVDTHYGAVGGGIIEASNGALHRRIVEIHRADHSLLARYVFDGKQLVTFQWQEGGLTARRLGEEERRLVRERLAERDG